MEGEEKSVARSNAQSATPPFSAFDLLDLSCVAIAAIVAVSVALNDKNAVRAVAAFAFILFVPGRSVVTHWPAIAAHSHVAVSVLFSLALTALLATAAIWAHFWHPLGLLEAECVVTAGVLILGIMRRRRAADQAPAKSALQIERDQ